MNRRVFLSSSVTLATAAFAGCASFEQSEADSSDDSPESEADSSDNERGPMGPEKAVEQYNNAVELLEKNVDKFENARQRRLLGEKNLDFSTTIIISRTTEVRNQLDRAEQEDDGSLTDEIETLRQAASYHDALASYTEESLRLGRLTNSGIDYYIVGQHQAAIDSLQNAQQQIEPTRAALENVDQEFDKVQDAAERAEMSDRFRGSMLMAAEDHTEIHEELNWLEHIVPARIAEFRGDLAIELATDAFENEDYETARSQYSDAENYFVSAKTHLDGLNVNAVTPSLERLVTDAERLACEYEILRDVSDEMQKASDAMRNNNPNEADHHLESADVRLSRINTC